MTKHAKRSGYLVHIGRERGEEGVREGEGERERGREREEKRE